MSVKPGPAQAFASTGLLTFFSSGGNSGDTVQQLTSSMRQKQSLALLSCDLHRKSVVPIVQNVPVVPIANACCGQFQSFQPFNRYAPFKAFKTELGRDTDAVLRDVVGYSAATINALRQDGVLE